MLKSDVNLRLEDIASVVSNDHRILDIVSINCIRFKFDVNIRHVLGSEKNVSRFVNSPLLFSKGGPAEFRRDKEGNITMHLPISTDVNHTGRYQEVDDDAMEVNDDAMEVDEIEEEEVNVAAMDVDVNDEVNVRERTRKRWCA